MLLAYQRSNVGADHEIRFKLDRGCDCIGSHPSQFRRNCAWSKSYFGRQPSHRRFKPKRLFRWGLEYGRDQRGRIRIAGDDNGYREQSRRPRADCCYRPLDNGRASLAGHASDSFCSVKNPHSTMRWHKWVVLTAHLSEWLTSPGLRLVAENP